MLEGPPALIKEMLQVFQTTDLILRSPRRRARATLILLKEALEESQEPAMLSPAAAAQNAKGSS